MVFPFDRALQGIGARFQTMQGGGSPFGQNPFGAVTPFGNPFGQGGGPNFQGFGNTQGPGFRGFGGGQSPFGQNPFGNANPFSGSPFGGGGSPFGTPSWGQIANPFMGSDNDPFGTGAGAQGNRSSNPGDYGNFDWTGPATASDNQGLTAEAIDNFIGSKFAKSPMRGQGAFILQIANQYGVSVPLLIGIAWKESGMGTNVGAGNIFGITDPSRDQGLGGQRAFQSYSGVQSEIEAAARLLASSTYRGKSAADQIGMWYVGKEGDLNATDLAGNGTVGDYLNKFIAPTYQGLGLRFDQNGRGQQSGPRGVVTAEGAAFPVAGFHGQVQLHHGSHPGAADLFAPAGTAVYAMRGGKVTAAGYDETGGYYVMIQGDDGLTYYYAHMQTQPGVRAGQTIQAGFQIGKVGDTGNAKGTGAHLHLGIGYGIISGTGPSGGAGQNFNAAEYLTRVLGKSALQQGMDKVGNGNY